jgi:hypothetical protein
MNRDGLKRLAVVANALSPEEPPTRCFFAGDLFRAQAGFGGKSAADILDDVEHVNAAVADYDRVRRDHRLDLVDFAILVQRSWYSDYVQDAGAIDGLITGAFWHWDVERYGRDRAWSNQNGRQRFEGVIDGRLRQTA